MCIKCQTIDISIISFDVIGCGAFFRDQFNLFAYFWSGLHEMGEGKGNIYVFDKNIKCSKSHLLFYIWEKRLHFPKIRDHLQIA